ncbi:MAG: alpha/beta hydrolase [Pseudomonadota bacterium]
MTRRGFLTTSAAATLLTGCASTVAPSTTAETQYPPVGRFVEVDGLKMHYIDEGQGPPIVLVHGANGNVRDWTFSMTSRLRTRYRVIAMDRPGHGYSQRPATDGANPMKQAQLIADATAAIGIDRAVIAGHSWGGAVATSWALSRPDQVAGAAILAGATYPWGGDGGLLYSLGSGPFGPAIGAIARAYVSGPRVDSMVADVFAPNPTPPGYVDHIGVPLALRPSTFRWNADDIDQLNGNLEQIAPRYGELAMPLEVLHGDVDETVLARIHSVPLAAEAMNARLTILEGVGHMLHHVEEDTIVAAIDRLMTQAFA